jgi:hypothetical protein
MKSKVSKVLVALGIGVVLVSVGKFVSKEASLKPAIFKIGGGRPWCTAFAISDTTAVTAQHCIADESVVSTGTIEMYEANNKSFGTAKVYRSKHPVLDIAMISGDFKNRQHLPISKDRYELEPSDSYKTCGFPLMVGNVVCSTLKVTGTLIQQDMFSALLTVTAQGYMVFGMSGGPVFNESKGVVVAVNTGIADRELLISPFIDIEESTVPVIGSSFFRSRTGNTGITADMLHDLGITTLDLIK